MKSLQSFAATDSVARLKILRGYRKLPYILALAPILFLGVLLAYKTVDVPYWDQWELVPIIQHVHEGHYYFNDFWQQHNEHRLLLPRIVMIASATLTHWNLQAENVISFVIACIAFVLIMKALRRTQRQLKHGMLFLVPLLIGLIWFSPVQFENWLWGWQIQWFLSITGIVMVILGLANTKGRDLSNRNLVLVLAGGVIALYSLGNGVVIWPLLVAALLYARVSLKKTAIVAFTAALTSGLYYYHYINVDPSPESSKLLALHEPVLFIKYVLTYIGRPLNFLHGPTALFGALLLAVFVGLTTYLFIKRRVLFRALLPWVVLGLYVCGSAVITALSRMGLGLGQAYASRYTTVSSLLLVATIILLVESREIFKAWGKKFNVVALCAIALVFACVLSNAAWGVRNGNRRTVDLRNSQICTHTAAPSDACALYAYPNKEVLLKRLNYLKQIHWGGY